MDETTIVEEQNTEEIKLQLFKYLKPRVHYPWQSIQYLLLVLLMGFDPIPLLGTLSKSVLSAYSSTATY